MKRASIVLTILAFSACATVPPAVLTRVRVDCGAKVLVYSNADKMLVKKVTVDATDRCAGSDSEVQLTDPSGAVVDRFPVPDGTTKTIQVSVRPDYSLNFACMGSTGKDGACSYVVSTE